MPVILLGGTLPQPDTVAGLTGWFKSDYGLYKDAGVTPVVDNDLVYRWLDASSHATYAEMSTVGNRPTYKTGSLNGQPTVNYVSATSRILISATWNTFAVNNAATVFWCGIVTAANSGLWSSIAGGQTQSGVRESGGNLQNHNYSGAPNVANKAVTLNIPIISTWMHTGGNVYGGVSDTRTASLASTASGNTSDMTGALYLSQTSAVYGDDKCAEMCIFNTGLSEANRQVVERYLAAKYSIALPY